MLSVVLSSPAMKRNNRATCQWSAREASGKLVLLVVKCHACVMREARYTGWEYCWEYRALSRTELLWNPHQMQPRSQGAREKALRTRLYRKTASYTRCATAPPSPPQKKNTFWPVPKQQTKIVSNHETPSIIIKCKFFIELLVTTHG